MEDLFDIIVIGGGPAGCAAAMYAARKKLKTLLITNYFGGQSIVSDDIQNWLGETHITGVALAKKFEDHVRSFSEITIKDSETVQEVTNIQCDEKTRICDFKVRTDKATYVGKAVIVCTGARRRKLGVPGEDLFEGKGLSYCSTCDAPLFIGRKVAVIGGGNSGLETVQDLFPYASEIYLLEYSDSLRGDMQTQEEIKSNSKLKQIILNVQPIEIMGDTLVTGLKYKNLSNGEEQILEVGGIFVEIGSVPNTEVVKHLVQLDEHNQIMINVKHATTSHPGIFAAGDVTDDPYKQNNIAAGDGVRAALSAYNYLLKREKKSPAADRHDF